MQIAQIYKTGLLVIQLFRIWCLPRRPYATLVMSPRDDSTLLENNLYLQ